MICDSFVCKHGVSCINEPICDLYKCPRYVSAGADVCNLCLYQLACSRRKSKKYEIANGKVKRRK